MLIEDVHDGPQKTVMLVAFPRLACDDTHCSRTDAFPPQTLGLCCSSALVFHSFKFRCIVVLYMGASRMSLLRWAPFGSDFWRRATLPPLFRVSPPHWERMMLTPRRYVLLLPPCFFLRLFPSFFYVRRRVLFLVALFRLVSFHSPSA